ncbi:MAG: hypothetical protein QOG20_3751 [Pseudonocardiales bacterium]|nr:hypothetical protein [Pseudonocardiales bacterium]
MVPGSPRVTPYTVDPLPFDEVPDPAGSLLGVAAGPVVIGGGSDPGVEAAVGPLALFSIVAPLVSWGHAAAMVPLVTSISRTSTKGTRAGAGSFRLPLLPAVLGLIVDVPAGVVTLRPPSPSPVGEVRVRGLAVGGGRLDVDIDRDGRVTHVAAPAGMRVELG